MSKHTAGEWKYQHRHVWANDYKTETLSDGSEVELNHRICEVDEGPTEAQAEANARLIAAAPDMLDALEWAAKSVHHPVCPISTGKGQTTVTHDDCNCHVKEARAAIAKATGEGA